MIFIDKDSEATYLDRRPYTVNYTDYKTGELKTLRRRPPEQLHEMLPLDEVRLNAPHGESGWPQGDTYTVASVHSRSPNLLQIENDDGEKTFHAFHELELVEKRGKRATQLLLDNYSANRYLTWP